MPYEFTCLMCKDSIWAHYNNLEHLKELVKFHLHQEHVEHPSPELINSMIRILQPLPPERIEEAVAP